jgi:hypothetical protein
MIAGEPLDMLINALATIKPKKTREGMVRITAEMGHDLGSSFVRALMRVEAELLAQDAEMLRGSESEFRTPDQRRADALVALVLRVTDAAQPGSGSTG